MSPPPPEGWGGARPRSGRPPSEPTKHVRVPISQLPKVVAYLDATRLRKRPGSNISESWEHDHEAPPQHLVYVEAPRPHAGFPSPAVDYVESVLDLRELLVRNPPATFYVRLKGDSLKDLGLLDGDVLVVDRSLTPKQNSIVIAVYDGDILVKQLGKYERKPALLSRNDEKAQVYKPLPLEGHDHEFWGVVTGVARKF